MSTTRIMAGDSLIASILRRGNGRKEPVRWISYFSIQAERLGAVSVPAGYKTKRLAELAALKFAEGKYPEKARIFEEPRY